MAKARLACYYGVHLGLRTPRALRPVFVAGRMFVLMETVVVKGVKGAALFSMDGRYRYALSRKFTTDEASSICQFIMLNPSTADGDVDDPTVARCIKYAKRWGHDGLVVTNLFAWRATDPRDLYSAVDPFGDNNRSFVLYTALQPAVQRVVCAWGTHGGYLNAGREMLGELLDAGVHPQVLKWTKDFHPAHPLYLPGDLEPFDAEVSS